MLLTNLIASAAEHLPALLPCIYSREPGTGPCTSPPLTSETEATGYCNSVELERSVVGEKRGATAASSSIDDGGNGSGDEGAAAGGGGRRLRRRKRAAHGGVLREQLPARGAHRQGIREAARPARAVRGRHAPPHPLPRLLRQGLRRVRAAQRDGRQRGGAGRGAQPDAAQLRLHRPHQGRPREGVPRRCLLRRHPRARRPGLRRCHRRTVLGCADGEAGRHGVHQAGGAGPDPGAHHELHPAPPVLPEQEPQPRRPRLALRCPHHRHLPLQLLHGAPVQLHRSRRPRRRGPVAGLGVRGQPAADQVQDADGQHHHRGDGPGQLPHLRRELLPRLAQAPGPVPVRRRAHHGRGGQGRRPQRTQRPARVLLPGLRGLHGEDGTDRRQDRIRGRDQEALRRRQQTLVPEGRQQEVGHGSCWLCYSVAFLFNSFVSIVFLFFDVFFRFNCNYVRMLHVGFCKCKLVQ